jgi:hypothetical protein
MEISVSELNELLQKEFDRGRQCPTPQINTPYVQIKDWKPEVYTVSNKDNVPEACKNCSNNPSNGGSGLCHCILGLTPVKCTINEANCYSTGNGMTYTISKTTDNIK